MVWKGYKRAQGVDKALIIGVCSACISYFIQNQFSFGHIPIITLFWFLIGLSVVVNPIGNFSAGGASSGPRIESSILKRRITGYGFERIVKYIICVIVICLMILLILFSLFRYKADIYFSKGRSFLNKSLIVEAIESYERAVSYNPLEMSYRNVLNGIYMRMAVAGLNEEYGGNRENTPDFFKRDHAPIWLTNTIMGAKAVQKLYPHDYNSAFTLGQAYHILDDVSSEDMSDEALKYYKRAVKLHPFKFGLRHKLAQLYNKKGRYQEAIQELNEAIYIAPGRPIPYADIANIYINDKRYEEAREVLMKFIEKNPNRQILSICRLLNYVYYKTEKWEEILKQSEKIIKMDKDNLEAQKYSIIANFKLGRFGEVRRRCNLILELSETVNGEYKEYAENTLEILRNIQGTETTAQRNLLFE